MYQAGEKILLTLWVGSMWAIGYIVAPVLFNMLERTVAGNVAGQLFTLISYLGLFSGFFLIINMIYRDGLHKDHWQLWLLAGMLILILIGQFIIQPMMTELKTVGLSDSNHAEFARLHGVSSILYLVNSIAGLILVISGTRYSRNTTS